MSKKDKREWKDLNVFEKLIGLVVVGFIAVAVIMGVSGAFDSEPEEKAVKQEQQGKNKQKVKKETKEDENMKKKVDEELTFAELTINVEDLKVYVEDGRDLAEINFSWINQAGDGNKYFFALMGESVKQGEEALKEVSGAYDMENKKTNSMHEHNPEGGKVNIKLVYELKDKVTPLEMTFTPLNGFNEEKQVINIDLD